MKLCRFTLNTIPYHDIPTASEEEEEEEEAEHKLNTVAFVRPGVQTLEGETSRQTTQATQNPTTHLSKASITISQKDSTKSRTR